MIDTNSLRTKGELSLLNHANVGQLMIQREFVLLIFWYGGIFHIF